MILLLCLPLCACNGSATSAEERFAHATAELNRYQNTSLCYNADGDPLFGNNAARYLYEQFLALKDYKTAASYLDGFSILPDALTKILKTETDAFGNQNETTYRSYEYGKSKNNPEDTAFLKFLGVWSTAGFEFVYEYDGGFLSQTDETVEKNDSTIEKRSVYTNDAQGRVLSIAVTENSSSYTLTYQYETLYLYTQTT